MSSAIPIEYPPLPKPVSSDEAEQARRRLASKPWLGNLFTLPAPSRRQLRLDKDTTVPRIDEPETVDVQSIVLSEPIPASDNDDQDKFAWAVLYENQRGLTLFSTRSYSHRSLLPMDPAPFTLPSASFARSKQPFMSLNDYQFPDGTWRWVSKTWMIDMRSDSGEIQHDGFEYNWFFRRHHWRAEVGPLSAGGWVRRRRWVRLMMRPAKQPNQEDEELADGGTSSDAIANRRTVSIPSRNSIVDVGGVWRDQSPEENWNRCHALMKQLDRDGRKLDVWLRWLDALPTEGKGKQVMANGPTREQIMHVLEIHMDELLRLFVFPESRARLLAAVGNAGVGAMVEAGRAADFWSYRDELM